MITIYENHKYYLYGGNPENYWCEILIKKIRKINEKFNFEFDILKGKTTFNNDRVFTQEGLDSYFRKYKTYYDYTHIDSEINEEFLKSKYDFIDSFFNNYVFKNYINIFVGNIGWLNEKIISKIKCGKATAFIPYTMAHNFNYDSKIYDDYMYIIEKFIKGSIK